MIWILGSCAHQPPTPETGTAAAPAPSPSPSVPALPCPGPERNEESNLQCVLDDFRKSFSGLKVFDLEDLSEDQKSTLNRELSYLHDHGAPAIEFYRKKLSPETRDQWPAAALLLGHLKAQEALPRLRQMFLEVDTFYGFEGSFPDTLYYRQFPEHFAIEVALGKITGQDLEKVVQLTSEEETRFRKSPTLAARYVLFRLAREKSHQLYVRQLAGSLDPKELCEARFLLTEYFGKKLLGRKAAVRKSFGKSAREEAGASIYDCGDDIWPRYLKVSWGKGADAPKSEMLSKEP